MSTEDPREPEGEHEPEQEPDWKRRRRLAAVFGDTVPEQTSDDRDPREPASCRGSSR